MFSTAGRLALERFRPRRALVLKLGDEKPRVSWVKGYFEIPELNARAVRAGGCQGCGRPHGETIRCLPDGRWFDVAGQTWRNDRGRLARWPDIEEATRMRQTRVVLAAAHLDHNPGNNRLGILRSFCQRCHLIHDRPRASTDHLPVAPGARRPVLRPLLRLTFVAPVTASGIFINCIKKAQKCLGRVTCKNR